MTSPAIVDAMKVVATMEPSWFEERRRMGGDRWDEVWDGVLHVPPTPASDHQRFESHLLEVLRPLARRRSLEAISQLGVLDPRHHDHDYRIPDISVITNDHILPDGTEGPVALAIEILSPNDESREKIPFYAARGVQELWLVEPRTRAHEIYLLRGSVYFIAVADRSGITRAPALDLELSIASGPKLRLAWADGAVEI
jgi:Uma2 family endonuclease